MVRNDLPDLLYEIIKSLGGKASMTNILREFLKLYASKLNPSEICFIHGIMIFVGLLQN